MFGWVGLGWVGWRKERNSFRWPMMGRCVFLSKKRRAGQPHINWHRCTAPSPGFRLAPQVVDRNSGSRFSPTTKKKKKLTPAMPAHNTTAVLCQRTIGQRPSTKLGPLEHGRPKRSWRLARLALLFSWYVRTSIRPGLFTPLPAGDDTSHAEGGALTFARQKKRQQQHAGLD